MDFDLIFKIGSCRTSKVFESAPENHRFSIEARCDNCA